MKKNEKNWRNWYLANLGEAWQGAGFDTQGLTERQRALGQLLYERYRQEARDAQDRRYDRLVDAQQARERVQAVDVAEALRRRYAAETAAIEGLGSGQTELAEREARQAYRTARTDAQNDNRAAAEGLERRYVAKEQKADAALARALAEYEKDWAAKDAAAWRELRQDMSKRLPAMTSAVDPDRYTAEGIAELRALVEENKENLGGRYDEARSWVDELPLYRDDGARTTVHGENGRDYVVDVNEWRLADVVQYVRGAGTKVTSLDVMTIRYDGVDYRIRSDKAVGAAKDAYLDALAASKGVRLTTGAILYSGGALYVYDGLGQWLSTRNGSLVGRTGLEQLLRRIAADNE